MYTLHLYDVIIFASLCHAIDINECLSSPCQHNATCTDLINGFNCSCTSGFSGSLCNIAITTTTSTTTISPTTTTSATTTTIPASIPRSRYNLAVTLNSITFDPALLNTSSSQYIALRANVSKTLETTLSSLSNYEIKDITFRQGSVIVTYTLDIVTVDSSTTLASIFSIINSSQSFGAFTIKPGSLSYSSSTTYNYIGTMKIISLDFDKRFSDSTTSQYAELSNSTSTHIVDVFKRSSISSHLVGIDNVQFSKGSVIIEYVISFDKFYTIEELKTIIQNELLATSSFIGSFVIEPTSIQFRVGNVLSQSSNKAVVPITLGAVLSVLLVTSIVCIVVYILYYKKKHTNRVTQDYSDNLCDSSISSSCSYDDQLSARPKRVWQHQHQQSPMRGPGGGILITGPKCNTSSIRPIMVRDSSDASEASQKTIALFETAQHGHEDKQDWKWEAID